MRAAVLTFVLAATACGVPQDSWPEASAKAACKYQVACNKLAFNTTWTNMSSCVAATAASTRVTLAGYDATCRYHQDIAATCTAAQKRAARRCDPRDVEAVGLTCASVITCDAPGSDTLGGGGGGGGGGDVYSSSSFADAYAKAFCGFSLTCGGGSQSAFNTCVKEAKKGWADFIDECTVNQSAATKCINAVNTATTDCDFTAVAGLADICGKAWKCEAGGGPGGPGGMDTSN